MPAVKSGAKVLVTGANGYIASWIVKYLLEKGYTVRGTVRSEAKGAHLKEQFAKYGDKLELVNVADITAAGAFDQAAQGADAILHTASPFHFAADDPKELIDPAVKGTTGILESALKHSGAQLQRVVILSSVASVANSSATGFLDESSWNQQSLDDVEKHGKAAAQDSKYRASKTLAEKAGWEFVEKHKGEISWDLVTLCPPFVFGPFLHEVSSPSSLNTSAKLFYDNILKGTGSAESLTSVQASWIDVRDVALAHIAAIEYEKSGNERFIISAGTFCYQDFLDEANALAAADPSLGSFIAGPQPGYGKTLKYNMTLNNQKSINVLEITYKDKKTTTLDIINEFKAKGWL